MPRSVILKAGFHMIADNRRRSRIADDRKESCFHIIADDRKRSQSRLQPYISVIRNVKCTCALCSRQNFSKQHSGHRGGNFAASKFTSFSPQATASSASKAKETSVLIDI